MSNYKKIAAAISGALGAVGVYVSSVTSVAHAQFVLTTTTTNEAVGDIVQPTFEYTLSALTSGGVILFMIGILLLGGFIALALWGVSKLFKRRRA